MPDTSKENVGGAKPRTVAAEVISARSPRGPRRHVSGKIMRLPVEVRQALDARLAAGSFGGYRALSRWLEETHNQFISPSALNHYFKYNFEQSLDAVKIATAQAIAIVRECGDSDDEMNRALTRVVQSTLFQMLIELNKTCGLLRLTRNAREISKAHLNGRQKAAEEKGQSATPPIVDANGEPVSKFPLEAELAAVASVGRTVALLGKVQLEWTRWRDAARVQVAKSVEITSVKLSEAAKDGGLSAEAEIKIRAALMEIRV